MKASQEPLNWLLENSRSIIRYRTAKELLGESDNRKIELLTKELLSNRLAQLWLDYLRPNFDRNIMHGSKPEAYENAMGKLYEFGLRKGMKPLDERIEPFRLWLEEQMHLPNIGYFPVFYRCLLYTSDAADE